MRKFCVKLFKYLTAAALSVSMSSFAYASSYIPPSAVFARDLQVGSSGNDVKDLQQFLNANGFTVSLSGAGSPGNETDLFGDMTKSALVRFQDANAAAILSPQGLTNGTGMLGPSTRSFINALTTVSSAAPLSSLVPSVSDSNDSLPPYTVINNIKFYKTDPGDSVDYIETTAGWVKITSGAEYSPVVQTGGGAPVGLPPAPVGPPQIAVSYALGSDGTFGDYTPLNSGDTIPGQISGGDISLRIDNTGEGPLTTAEDSPVTVAELSSAVNWSIIQPDFPIASGGSQYVTLSAGSYNSETNTFDISTNDPTDPDFSIIVHTNS